ncbi:Tyrosine-protein kinase [Trema orientale]|uniref:Tyrosine-protein kinase n=1 Tax=Trema orientale TaxID=63057 RepID=A0A2P5F9Q8_TREOI|nr:Tyrosine-protein kinase [Trema orientale]
MGLLSAFRSCLESLRPGRTAGSDGPDNAEDGLDSFDLFFDLNTLQIATNFFSELNKLGHGGFGPVFKGLMPNGQEVAVKKLSLTSRQGVREFTNEVKLLLKLQHKNLVQLLGCCVEGPEKMLVYEYLPNKSLDYFLFGKTLNTWMLYQGGKALEILDPNLTKCNRDEAAMCIQLGLLCCQAAVADRPDMNSVHLMLSSDSFTLPRPTKPGIQGRVGRWTTTSTSAFTNTNPSSGYTGGTKASASGSIIVEEYSRNSISVSSIDEGR